MGSETIDELLSLTACLSDRSEPQSTPVATLSPDDQSAAGGSSMSFHPYSADTSTPKQAKRPFLLPTPTSAITQSCTAPFKQKSNLPEQNFTWCPPDTSVPPPNLVCRACLPAAQVMSYNVPVTNPLVNMTSHASNSQPHIITVARKRSIKTRIIPWAIS